MISILDVEARRIACAKCSRDVRVHYREIIPWMDGVLVAVECDCKRRTFGMIRGIALHSGRDLTTEDVEQMRDPDEFTAEQERAAAAASLRARFARWAAEEWTAL